MSQPSFAFHDRLLQLLAHVNHEPWIRLRMFSKKVAFSSKTAASRPFPPHYVSLWDHSDELGKYSVTLITKVSRGTCCPFESFASFIRPLLRIAPPSSRRGIFAVTRHMLSVSFASFRRHTIKCLLICGHLFWLQIVSAVMQPPLKRLSVRAPLGWQCSLFSGSLFLFSLILLQWHFCPGLSVFSPTVTLTIVK